MPGKSAERSAGTHGGDVPVGGSPRGRHLESQPEEADVDRFSDGGRVHDGVGHVQAPPVRRPSDRSQALPSTRSIWDIFGLGGGGGSGRGKGSDVDRKKGEAGRSWWVSHSNFGTPREGEERVPSRRGSTTANESHGSEEGFSWPVESEGEGGEGEGEDSWDGSAAGIGSSPPTPSGGHTADTSLITFSARKGRVDRAAGCAFGTKGTPQSLSEYTLHNHDEAQTLPTREEAGAGVGVEAGAGYDYRDELGSFEDIAVLLDDEGGEKMPREDQHASMASDWRRKDIARVESDFKSLQPVIFTAAAARGAGATVGPGTSAGDDDDDDDGDCDGDEAWEGKNEADDANDEVFKSQGNIKRSVSFAHALKLARAGSDGSMGYTPPLLGGMSLSSMMPHQGYLVKGKRSMSIMKNIIDGMTTSFALKVRLIPRFTLIFLTQFLLSTFLTHWAHRRREKRWGVSWSSRGYRTLYPSLPLPKRMSRSLLGQVRKASCTRGPSRPTRSRWLPESENLPVFDASLASFALTERGKSLSLHGNAARAILRDGFDVPHGSTQAQRIHSLSTCTRATSDLFLLRH